MPTLAVRVFAIAAAALSAPFACAGYDVAAYVWPAYQPEPRWKELGIFAERKRGVSALVCGSSVQEPFAEERTGEAVFSVVVVYEVFVPSRSLYCALFGGAGSM